MKLKKLLVITLLSALAITNINTVAIKADDDIPAQKVTKIIAPTGKIVVGDKFELKAVLYPIYADDDNIKWKIVGKKGIVQFEENDRYDEEAELIAVKAGTTKLRCSVIGKSKKYSATVTITVKKESTSAKKKITRVGAKTVNVEVGDDFELKVKKGSKVKNSHLKWTIKKTSIVGFDYDDDNYYGYNKGKQVEFKARKVGKTTITCKNTKTGQKVKFTINVIPDYDYDDDDDDDWDDDWDD